jgi:hypothetical protein
LSIIAWNTCTAALFLVAPSFVSPSKDAAGLCPPLQIVDEKMLVYINDLLASGEIPDLFAQVRMPACSIHVGAPHAAR